MQRRHLHIVAEGKSDELIIRQLLGSDLKMHADAIRTVVGGGRSSSLSLARSILGARQEPVALVVDSDTTNSDQIAEQREFISWYMGQAAGDGMWHVVLFQPTVESVLFADATLLPAILNLKPDERQQVRAEYDPKRVLREMLDSAQISEKTFWRRLAGLKYQWDALASKLPEVRSLKEFIRKHVALVTA